MNPDISPLQTPNPNTQPIPIPTFPDNFPQTDARVQETVEMFNRAEKVLKAMQTPQAIRELPQFDGNPVSLHKFIRAVENLLPFLETMKNTPFEEVWLQSIRAKITGHADQVLEIYGTTLKWDDIKSNLIAYYNDKRDSVTLTRELFQLQQSGTIEDFFGSVQQLLSLLINHTNISTNDAKLKADRITTHQENALQVFLAGLREPIGGNVRARQPKKLKEAFDACVEERNFQNRFGLNKIDSTPRPPKPIMPPPSHPPRQKSFPNFNNYQRQFPPISVQNSYPRQFHQAPTQNQYNRPFQQQQYQQQQLAPRHFSMPYSSFNKPPVTQRNVFAPKPVNMPKPSPMEVDPSIRSNKINYMNRPQRSINHHEGSEFYERYAEFEEQYNYPESQCYSEEPVQDKSGDSPSDQPLVNADDETDELNFRISREIEVTR